MEGGQAEGRGVEGGQARGVEGGQQRGWGVWEWRGAGRGGVSMVVGHACKGKACTPGG